MSSNEENCNSDTCSDSSTEFYQLAGLGASLGAYALKMSSQPPMVNPQIELPQLTGRQWVEQNLQDRRKCYTNFRMTPDAFLQLHDALVRYHGLISTREVESVESLAMFLWACATRQSCRDVGDRFEHSVDTVCRKMGNVADAMLTFAHTVIKPKDPTYSKVSHKLSRFKPWFDGCIGALDGTHIPIQINRHAKLDYLNRKQRTSFNVLGIVDMNMRFTFVGVGRAGSVHDMSVLTDCMAECNYPHPPHGRYYLVDSGYALRRGYLPPYRETRYHLDEFRNRGPETLEEKFNCHHSSLRSVVERAFGVLKSRWHILEGIPLYEGVKQKKIVIACFALHNFLVSRSNENMAAIQDYEVGPWVLAADTDNMEELRNWIAAGLAL